MKARLFMAVACALLARSSVAGTTLCNPYTYGKSWIGNDPACCAVPGCTGTCALGQTYACADGQEVGGVHCVGFNENNQCAGLECPGGSSSCNEEWWGLPCPVTGSAETCDGSDNDGNGCIDEGCTKGKPPCECTKQCTEYTCNPAHPASCNAYKDDVKETCFDGEDNNCNGEVDEGCELPIPEPKPPTPQPRPPNPNPSNPKCEGGTAGADPIMISTQSAITEPFLDFEMDSGLVWLGISRTYTSNDWSYAGGPVGFFGRGWHHEWEAWLTCSDTKCTVVPGTRQGMQFELTGTAVSLDGTETWQIYQPWSDEDVKDDHHDILVRRPSGGWIVYGPDGTELHFDSVCDACSGSDVFCQDAATGGRARLVKVVDTRGNSVHLSYNRPGGIPLTLSDDLGHSLQLRSTSACTDGLVSSLQYDGMTVANYSYAGTDLVQASDVDGAVLRSYVYDTAQTGRLLAVKNQTGDVVVSFSYDAANRAVGIIDVSSSVSVDYDAPGGIAVTEFYGSTSSTSVRQLDQSGHVTSVSDGCACGPARTLQWTDRRLTCSMDAQGHVSRQYFDSLGRLIRRGLRENEWVVSES